VVSVDDRRRSDAILQEADKVNERVLRIVAESDAARRRRLVQAIYVDRQRNHRGPADG
jgi:hypothetical protein